MAQLLKFTKSGSGTPVVFIHGWGLNSGVWQDVAQQFAKSFQVITIDLPGFGLNHQVELTDYSIEAISQQIVDVIKEPAVYVGWSLGGLVATQIALDNPQQVLGLVTVTSSPNFVEQEDWSGIKAKVLKSFHLQLAKNSAKTIDTFLAIQAMGSPHIRQDIKRIQELINQYPSANSGALDKSLNLLETVDLRLRLAEISLPFMRLYGRLDTLVPKDVIAEIDKLNPKSTRYVFEQASHAPFISDRAEFVGILTKWLREHILTK